jgi:type II secretory pathway component HofQ
MQRLLSSLCRPAGAPLLFLVLAAGAQAAPAKIPADADSRKPEPGSADKIRKALDQTLTLELNEQPLTQALQQLHDQTKVNFILDRATLEQMGVAPDEANVTIKAQNIKLRAGLRTLLGQYNLSYVILGDTVVITSHEMAIHRQMHQRINVDLDAVPLNTALKNLAKETATNLVLDPSVTKEGQTALTLQLEDVPLETAVRLLAEMGGLKTVRLGNVLFVTTKAKAVDMRADPDLSPPPTPTPQQPMPGMGFGPGGIPVPPPMPPKIAPPGKAAAG